MGQIHFPCQHGPLGVQIRPLIPDIAPIARGFKSKQRQFLFQQQRKYVLAKIRHAGSSNIIEDFRLQNVNASVHQIAEHPAPGRLFNKAGDAAVRAGEHHAIRQRHTDPLEHQRGQSLFLPMEGQRAGKIAIRHPIAGKHQKGALQPIPGHADAARRAKGRGFFIIAQLHAIFFALAKGCADLARLIAQRGPHILNAVGPQQLQRIAHGRLSQQRHQRLGQMHRQRPQTNPFAPGHDNRLYCHVSSLPFAS